MALQWLAITIIGLASLFTTTIAISCQKLLNTTNLPKCRCDESDTYNTLTCPINKENTFDIRLNSLDNNFEIDCKSNNLENMSIVPILNHNRFDQADFFGFIDCSMTEFESVTMKSIQTKHIKRLVLKKIKMMTSSDLNGFQINILHILESPLEELPEDLIDDLDLEQIFINSNNNITTLPARFFKNLTKLRLIDLGQNGLTTIPNGLFSNVPNLTTLILFGNKLSSINSEMFLGLNNVKVLELMSNQMANISEDAFINLPQLTDLSLRNNHFKIFPSGLFKNNKKLRSIKIDNNPFLTTLPNDLMANLTELQAVFINYCNLSTLPETVFWGSGLSKLYLDHNRLTNIPENIFLGVENLSMLYMSYNKLKYLDKDLFKDTVNIQEMYLDHNDLEILVDDVFSSIKHLKILNLSYNKLYKIMDNSFAGLKHLESLFLQNNSLINLTRDSFKHFHNLTMLDMSYNKLSLEQLFYKGERFSILPLLDKLETLNLQHNEIPFVFSDWVVATGKLRELNLAYNNITSLDYSELQFLQDHEVRVNLEYNKISTIDLSAVERLFVANKDNIPHYRRKIYLKGNPIICDCRIYDLVRYIDGTMNEEVRKVLKLNINDIKCQTAKKYIGQPLNSLKSESLTCILDDGPKLPAKCKQNLSQHYQFRQFDNRLIMNCSNTGITEMPHIDFNNNTRYKGFDIEVSLSGNNIIALSKPAQGYENVVELDLSHNNISEIKWIPPKIEVLKLHNNNITYLNCDELSLINNATIRNLTFHNNPWRCDCNLVNFTKYLQENFKKVSNLHEITCDEDGHRELTRLTPEDLCPNNVQIIAVICALLAVLGLLMAVPVALYFRYETQIKVWLYARNLCLYFITENELDQDKLYDAFISFSHEDEDFVVGELLPGLEEGPHPFRLCVHFRDWQPGEFITTNIARSIDESRRTVVVLSKRFLKSEWGKMEFRTAHTEALKEGRARVIMIVYGDIGPTDELDSELRAYLSTNTYIKWGTPWFWDSLRYALPHSSKFTQTNKPCTTVCTQPEKIVPNFDTVDLIKEPITPPAATTPPADSVRYLRDPLLHSALNVALIDGTLINKPKDKVPDKFANNNTDDYTFKMRV